MLSFLDSYKKELRFGPLFKWLEALFELFIPIIVGMIIDNGIRNRDMAYIYRYGALMVALGVLGYLFSLICQYYASVASQGYGTLVRDAIFKKINGLSVESFQKIGASSLIMRLISDVNQLQIAVAMLIRLVVRAPFLILGATLMVFLIDWQLALIFMLIIPIICVIIYFIMGSVIKIYKRIQQKLDALVRIMSEYLSGIRVIRAFANEQVEAKKFKIAAKVLKDEGIAAGNISALLNPLTFIVINSGIMLILWFGSSAINIGRLSTGELIAFSAYMTQILMALIIVANLVVLFTKSYASALRIAEVLELSWEETPVMEERFLTLRFDLRLHNVDFCYPDAQVNVLEKMNLAIPEGALIGIIGATGAGKSSLMYLLLNFFTPTAGEIYLGGTDLKTIPPAFLRKKIQMVPQNAVLITGSVADNLRMGKPDATDAQMWEALDIAQARTFVEQMESGLETMLTRGGMNLSGGQKQRLTIARALLVRPRILIFDDSSSALDYLTDEALQQAIRSRLSSMSVLIVSQRINSIRGADTIFVLETGKCVGEGTHAQLLKGSPLYREIAKTQLSDDELKATILLEGEAL